MNYINLLSIFAPSIALLILSTTMRLGNVRLAVTDIAKLKVPAADKQIRAIFIDRAHFLSTGLKHLNVSFILLVFYAGLSVVTKELSISAHHVLYVNGTVFFVVLLMGVINLYKESRLECKLIDSLGDLMSQPDVVNLKRPPQLSYFL